MHRFLPLAGLLALAACDRGGDALEARPQPVDPAIAAALDAPLMVDPDLAEMNEASAAGSFTSLGSALPLDDNSAEAIAGARAEAQRLVGGATRMLKAPAPRMLKRGEEETATIAAARRLAEGKGCPARATRTALWAAKLPALFPVYPRGAVQGAVGTDDSGCALRIVTYTSPVPRQEIVDFYYTAAKAGGFRMDHIRSKSGEALGGVRGESGFVMRLQPRKDGRSLVELTTGGEGAVARTMGG